MAPPVSHAPKHTCLNFPFCSRRQAQGSTAQDTRYCASCCKLPSCSTGDCLHRVTPGSPAIHSLCKMHFRSHIVRRSTDDWATCTNSTTRGCRHFSELQAGGLCFACKHENLPCRNAFYGCPSHVRSNPAGTKSCETNGHNKRKLCQFEPPLCPICRTAPVEPVARQRCSQCAQGLVPCIRGCGQRSFPGNGRYCTGCRPLSCRRRVVGKRALVDTEVFPKPSRPSSLCTFSPTCTNLASEDTLGRCSNCVPFTSPPCVNNHCNNRATVGNSFCESCSTFGPPCPGKRNRGCPYGKRARPSFGNMCRRCHIPLCPGFVGKPCVVGGSQRAQDYAGKPCRQCYTALHRKT